MSAHVDAEIIVVDHRPVQRTPISIGTQDADATSGQTRIATAHALMGWILAETTGTTAAACRLHDGSQTIGESLGRINLVANESVRDWFGPNGYKVTTGRIFMEIITGTIEGLILWR